MTLVALLVSLLDVALATAVFFTLARPDYMIALALRHLGLADPWFMEEVDAAELGRLRKLMRVISSLGLVAVFACSFIAGALLALGGAR